MPILRFLDSLHKYSAMAEDAVPSEDAALEATARRFMDEMETFAKRAMSQVEKTVKSMNWDDLSLEDWERMRELPVLDLYAYVVQKQRIGSPVPRKLDVWCLFMKGVTEKEKALVTPMVLDLANVLSDNNFVSFHEYIFKEFVTPYMTSGTFRPRGVYGGSFREGGGPVSISNNEMATRLVKRYEDQRAKVFEKLYSDQRLRVEIRKKPRDATTLEKIASMLGRGVGKDETMDECLMGRVGVFLPEAEFLGTVIAFIEECGNLYRDKGRSNCLLQVGTGHGVCGSILQIASVGMNVPIAVMMTHTVDQFPVGSPCLWDKKVPVIPMSPEETIDKYGKRATVLFLEYPPLHSEWTTEAVRKWRTEAGGKAVIMVAEMVIMKYGEDGTEEPDKLRTTCSTSLLMELESNWTEANIFSVPCIVGGGKEETEAHVFLYTLKEGEEAVDGRVDECECEGGGGEACASEAHVDEADIVETV
jgi:hypothetical protein